MAKYITGFLHGAVLTLLITLLATLGVKDYLTVPLIFVSIATIIAAVLGLTDQWKK